MSHRLTNFDPRDPINWGYRLLLNREPDEGGMRRHLDTQSQVGQIRHAILQSPEFINRFEKVREFKQLETLVNIREGVVWAFRFLLDKEITDCKTIDQMAANYKTVQQLRDAIVLSQEFQTRKRRDGLDSLITSSLLERFQPFCREAAPSGFFNDFLGVKTRCSFLPDTYKKFSGAVFSPPGSMKDKVPLHDTAEWIGTLHSILECHKELVVIELGAGWAPWLVGSAKAAEKLGIKNVTLLGVEGSIEHVEFMHQHFEDNGLDPKKHRLIHGVVGVEDGTARFPKSGNPSEQYGLFARYGQDSSVGMDEVPCISLRTLLSNLPLVDLLHCDVQGAEADVMIAARDILDVRVRRVVIGTHSRKIEGQLIELFASLHWRLEHESVCKLTQLSGGNEIRLVADGTQVWRNPKL